MVLVNPSIVDGDSLCVNQLVLGFTSIVDGDPLFSLPLKGIYIYTYMGHTHIHAYLSQEKEYLHFYIANVSNCLPVAFLVLYSQSVCPMYVYMYIPLRGKEKRGSPSTMDVNPKTN